MKEPLLGAFETPKSGKHMLGALQSIHLPMRRFKEQEDVDYVIVGVGSAGGVLLQRLARAGFNVVGPEAGPFWDTEHDWVSDETGSHELYWTEPRVTGGADPLALGANNCGKGVGGGSVQWAAFTPRLHPSDFEVYTRDGVGADWPITYQDILPYYEQLELEMPVAGPAYYPWGHPHGYAYGPHPMGGVGNALISHWLKALHHVSRVLVGLLVTLNVLSRDVPLKNVSVQLLRVETNFACHIVVRSSQGPSRKGIYNVSFCCCLVPMS